MTTVRLRARHLQHDHGALARLTEHTVCNRSAKGYASGWYVRHEALAAAQFFCRITAGRSAARAGLHAMSFRPLLRSKTLARNDTHVATTAAAVSKAKRNYNDWGEHLLREVERIIGFK